MEQRTLFEAALLAVGYLLIAFFVAILLSGVYALTELPYASVIRSWWL
jgi:hypothetical protein